MNNTIKNKIDLLAPVADMNMLNAAINAGCDSIYIGGKFGARAFSKSVYEENLLQYIKIAHLFNKKVYLTINTLIKNLEIDEFIKYTDFYYENCVDAFIVQDIGMARMLINRYKDIEIHASTQMNITSIESVKLLKEVGFKQVVLARELSLKEIKQIIDNVDIKIECFIHGSMCYSYSGCCYMSSFIGNNSGNRGRCKGACRLCYKYNDNDLYLLSLKDLSTIFYIKQLMNIGISCFKIEGRMRQDLYVATVVSQYRKIIDSINNNINIDNKKILDMEIIMRESYDKNGFCNYLEQHNSKNMIQYTDRKKRIINDDLINDIKNKYINNKLTKKIDVKVKLEIGKKIEAIIKKDDMEYKIYIDIIPLEAKTCAITKDDIIKQFNKKSNEYIIIDKIDIELQQNIFLPVSQINECRRKILEYDYCKHRTI